MRPPRPIKIATPKGLQGRKKKPRAKPVDRETPIQVSIVQWLIWALYPGSLINHSPNEIGVAIPDQAHRMAFIEKLKRKGMTPGWPDLDCHATQPDAPTITFKIEVKTDTGELSDNQIKVRAAHIAAGIPYCIARTVDDVQTFLEWEGIKTRIKTPRGPRP